MKNYLSEDEFSKNIKIWINGNTADGIQDIQINRNINSLRRLKDKIANELNFLSPTYMRIYNHNGLDLDDADIEYLTDNQVLYVSPDGSPFDLINYFNEFVFIRWIKSGGYGKVFLAKNLITNEDLAVKKIDISNIGNEEIYNIHREALYLESFRHKNIVKFYHSFIYENNFYSVMEYAKGGELGSYIDSQMCLSELTSKRLFQQIHSAVIYMHNKNVIHRDLKVNNILFLDEKKENLIVIDFGISGFYSGNIKECIKAGTTRFLPPELASGYNYSSNPKIDIWAMGVILYLMLFGVFPFDGNENKEIEKKIINEDHHFPSSIIVSNSCKQLINGMLEKNQQLRIDTHDKLFQKWYDDKDSLPYVVYKKEELINNYQASNNNNSNSPIFYKKSNIQDQINSYRNKGEGKSNRHSSDKLLIHQAVSLKPNKKLSLFRANNSMLLSETPIIKKEEDAKRIVNRVFSFKDTSPNKIKIKHSLISFNKK